MERHQPRAPVSCAHPEWVLGEGPAECGVPRGHGFKATREGQCPIGLWMSRDPRNPCLTFISSPARWGPSHATPSTETRERQPEWTSPQSARCQHLAGQEFLSLTLSESPSSGSGDQTQATTRVTPLICHPNQTRGGIINNYTRATGGNRTALA